MSEQTLFSFARMTPAEYRDDCAQKRLSFASKVGTPTRLKVGNTTKVYGMPLTREDYEGEARIVRVVSKRPEWQQGRRFYRCMVNFEEDGQYMAVSRLIEG